MIGTAVRRGAMSQAGGSAMAAATDPPGPLRRAAGRLTKVRGSRSGAAVGRYPRRARVRSAGSPSPLRGFGDVVGVRQRRCWFRRLSDT